MWNEAGAVQAIQTAQQQYTGKVKARQEVRETEFKLALKKAEEDMATAVRERQRKEKELEALVIRHGAPELQQLVIEKKTSTQKCKEKMEAVIATVIDWTETNESDFLTEKDMQELQGRLAVPLVPISAVDEKEHTARFTNFAQTLAPVPVTLTNRRQLRAHWQRSELINFIHQWLSDTETGLQMLQLRKDLALHVEDTKHLPDPIAVPAAAAAGKGKDGPYPEGSRDKFPKGWSWEAIEDLGINGPLGMHAAKARQCQWMGKLFVTFPKYWRGFAELPKEITTTLSIPTIFKARTTIEAALTQYQRLPAAERQARYRARTAGAGLRQNSVKI